LLDGWLSITRRYCINTAKHVFKLFQSLVASSFLFLRTTAPISNSNENPSVGALNTLGWEKLAIFDRNRPLSRNRCEIGRWLPWNVIRKSLMPDRTVSSSMTLSDPNPGFKVTGYLQVEYLRNGAF